MKTIKTKVVAIMLVLALALTGCVTQKSTVVINSDGSARMTTNIKVDKQAAIQAYIKMMKSQGQTVSEAEVTALITLMLPKLKDEGIDVKTVTENGKDYYVIDYSQNIKKGDLQKEFGVEGFDTYVTTDTFYMNGDIMKLLDAEDVDIFAAYKEMGVELKEEDIQTSITVQFPNAIVSTNGVKEASNPNAATFSIPLTGKVNMFATTKAGVTEASVKATIKKLNTVKSTKIKSLKANKVKKNAKKATVTLKFKKVKGIKKYEVEYSLKKNFKKSTVKTAKKTTYTIKNLKKGKKYYVRVRATKTNYAGNAFYSKWVKKSVKTKK